VHRKFACDARVQADRLLTLGAGDHSHAAISLLAVAVVIVIPLSLARWWSRDVDIRKPARCPAGP
jgi:hypothetical protein